MKLIQLSTLEFEQKLSREIEENPALDTINENLDNEKDEFDIEDNSENEEFNDDEIDISDYLSDDDIPDYNLRTNNHSEENENAIPFASGTSFNQFLKNQLHSFSFNSEDLKIAEFIVGSLDQFGYLRRDLIDISDDLAFSLGIDAQEDRIQKILDKVYLLDPAGVGAKNLQECLILQLKRKKITKNISNAIRITEDLFEEFSKRHFDKIKAKLNISDEDLRESISEIEKLNPKPGGAYNENTKMNSSMYLSKKFINLSPITNTITIDVSVASPVLTVKKLKKFKKE